MTAAVRSSAEDIDYWAPTHAEDHAGRAGMSLHERLSRTVVRGRAGLQGESPFGDLDDAPASSTQGAPDKIFETDAQGWLTSTAQGALPQAKFAVVTQTVEDDLPSPTAIERPQSVAMARFTEVVDALRGEFSPGDVAVVDAVRPAGDDCCPDGLSFKDETGPQDQLTDEAIEQVERCLLAQVDPIPDEIAVRPADDIQHALRQVREQIQAMEQFSDRAVERLAESAAEARRHLTPEFKSAGTARQLGVEIARIVDVMEARFERTEVASAKRVAELGAEIRQEIAQMIGALADRVSDLEPRATQDAVDYADPEPDSAARTACASDRMVEWEQDASPGRRERSIFAWLGFRPSKPSRTQPT